MKTFKFDMDGMFTFYKGNTMGEAIERFVKDRPDYVKYITNISEYKTS